jgi:hypothetical protein
MLRRDRESAVAAYQSVLESKVRAKQIIRFPEAERPPA